MARLLSAKQQQEMPAYSHNSTHSDFVLALAGGYQLGTFARDAHSGDEEILDLMDSMWFGVSCSPQQLPSRPGKAAQHAPAGTYPPLNTVHPVMQQPLALIPYQQRPAVCTSQQQVHPQDVLVRQQQISGHSNRMVPPAAMQQQVVVPGQPVTPSAAANGSLAPVSMPVAQQVPKSNSSSSIDMLLSQQQQQQREQQDNEQQPNTGPAPYVLGTWAQRQYIMPLHRSKGSPQQDTVDAAASTTPASSVPQPIRWPSSSTASKSGGSNSSKASGGAAAAGAAAGTAADPASTSNAHDSNSAAIAAAAAAAAAVDAAVSSGRRSIGTDDEDEAVMQAAWRWRFAKRWQAEQVRGPVDHAAASAGDGGMEEALQYLAACGENWHLGRAASTEVGGTVESRMLGTLGTPSLLGAELLVDESFSVTGGRGLLQSTGSSGLGSGFLSREASQSGVGRGEATRQVTSINKRAAQLLAAQSDIDKAASQRWREVQTSQASDLWVGALLECVEVDDWGKYKFLLLRLRDRSGRQKLLVRGANYASDAKIVEGLHRQMMAACATHDVCAEAIEVVGGGVMEWRRHRDRHLHISDGYVAPTSGPGGPTIAMEVMNLAAVLTKQHLPMHYKVTSDGGKVL